MFKKSKKTHQNGFTIVELLVVIAVLGILTVVLIAVIDPAERFKQSRDAQRKSDVRQIQSFIEQYYADNNNYPLASMYLDNVAAPCGGQLKDSSNGRVYMGKVPCDPTTGGKYNLTTSQFSTTAVGSYKIVSCLESSKTSQADSSQDTTDCPTANWKGSYTVSSSQN